MLVDQAVRRARPRPFWDRCRAATPGRVAASSVATAMVASVLALSTMVTKAWNGNDSLRKFRKAVMRSARCSASL